MTSGTVTKSSQLGLDRTELALDRTMMAAGRTLMAWVRTGLSQISFGFALFKFLHALDTSARATARPTGLVLIGLGIASVLAGGTEYIETVDRLNRTYERSIARVSVHLVFAIVIGIFGAALFLVTLVGSETL